MLNDFRVQTIVWDKAIDRIYETVRASEGDSNGRKLRVQILDRGKYVDLGGSSLSLAWKTSKEDAKGLDAFELVDSETGTFEIYYTTEMLGNVGRLSATLVLVDSVGRIESSPFAISVIESNVDDDSVQSENSFTALTQALITVSQYDSRISNLQSTKADRSYVDSENRKVNRKVDDEVERLDEVDREIISELAQTIQQNRIYIDDQLNQLNGLELKGAYNTLQELRSAYPNGTQGIFVVQENGHWYYWNGTWSDGGLYQATPWDEFMTENNEEWVV